MLNSPLQNWIEYIHYLHALRLFIALVISYLTRVDIDCMLKKDCPNFFFDGSFRRFDICMCNDNNPFQNPTLPYLNIKII